MQTPTPTHTHTHTSANRKIIIIHKLYKLEHIKQDKNNILKQKMLQSRVCTIHFFVNDDNFISLIYFGHCLNKTKKKDHKNIPINIVIHNIQKLYYNHSTLCRLYASLLFFLFDLFICKEICGRKKCFVQVQTKVACFIYILYQMLSEMIK